MSDDWQTIPEIVKAAKESLPHEVWDWACGGAESETTTRRNRTAFDYLAFRPRVLRGGGGKDLSTSFLGHRLSLPIMMAPVGQMTRFHPDGALAVARAAERLGTATFVGTMTGPSLADIAAGSNGPRIFQLYVRGDRDWLEKAVRMAENAGVDALCLTADSATYGRRERDIHNRYAPKATSSPNLIPIEPGGRLHGHEWQEALTWDDVDWLKSNSRLPLIVKGILNPDDAVLAVEHGVDAVYVSNHGGRELDHLPATIEMLPEIVRAVEGRAEVVVDSGFMRGTDVIKALALGAKAVLIGRLMCWGLAAGGDAGVECTLDILRTEMITTMSNLGIASVADIGPECVRPSLPPYPAPWPVSE
jgi:glycolate oxidase